MPVSTHLIPLFDANIFCGHYPFRSLPATTPAELLSLLSEAQIPRCIATPYESIFYRLPWSGLQPWLDADELPADQVWFWLTVNPLMPRWDKDIAAAADHPRIAGIRLFPRYHGYRLDHPAVAEVTSAAASARLPVNLTARLLDDRLHPYPLRVDDPLDMKAVIQVLKSSSLTTWVLSMFTMAELEQVGPHLADYPRVFCDIGCAKPFEFWGDHIRATLPPAQVIYGSGAPLYYHTGNRLSLVRTGFSPNEIRGFAMSNLDRLLAVRPGGDHAAP